MRSTVLFGLAFMIVVALGPGCERSSQIAGKGDASAGVTEAARTGGRMVEPGRTLVGGRSTGTGGVGGCGASCATNAAGGLILLPTYGADCGNGRLDSTESCDDGNRVSDDGCDDFCRLERHWGCPVLGQPCVRLCGNGTVDFDETCDDGNRISGDGCSADCLRIEEGWHCRVPGKTCTPVCGDGMIVGTETCDDGNTKGRDGCTRVCQIEGYICKSPEGKLCQPAACAGVDGGTPPCNLVLPTGLTCGDGIVSGDEECDDGNDPNRQPHNDDNAYGGCTTECKLGPYCGDGVVNGPEICDDGKANLPTYGRPGCTFACQKARYCGDYIIDEVWGEMCEPPYPEDRACTPGCIVYLP